MLVCLNERTGEGCGAINVNGEQRCRECGRSLRFALQIVSDTINERYRIIRGIGRGGFGAVYQAEDARVPGKLVAIKESFDTTEIRSFQREFQVLRNLRHPNLPRYYDMFEAEESGYLVMEFVPGQSFQDILNKKRGAMPEVLVLSYVVQLCDVLCYLHRQEPPITHRDIKPANIRLTPEGLIKLVDFGLVKWGTPQDVTTIPGGTRTYSAPEQWVRMGSTGPRSDIYSLGATLYHLLTGHQPTLTANRVVNPPEALSAPRSLNRNLAPHISNTIIRAMAINEEHRYPDVLSLKQALVCEQASPMAITPENAQRVFELDRRQGDVADSCKIAWSPDSNFLMWNFYTGHCVLWDVKADTTRYISDKEDNDVNVLDIAFSPDGQIAASVSYYKKKIKLWSVQDGELQRTLTGHDDVVLDIAFSPDGKIIASASQDKTIKLWQLPKGRLLHTLTGHEDTVWSVAFSSDGLTLASASQDMTVKLWRVSDGELLHTLEGHEGSVTSVAFAPDGQTLASGSQDTTIKLWRTLNGELVDTLERHDGPVWSVTFSPDGLTLASASQDKTVKLWRTRNGKLLQTLYGHRGTVWSVAFSPDGLSLASAGGTVRLWGAW